jgi:RHS repeat-associated protein
VLDSLVNFSSQYDGGDDAVTRYYWDHRNRLVLVAEHPEFGVSPIEQVWFTYDPQDRLIKRLVDPDGSSGSDPFEQTFYLWELGQIVLQFDRSGTAAVDGSHLSHRYLWGAAIDEALADEQVTNLSNAALNTTLWDLTNNLGSVTDAVDSAGTLRIHRDFDAFGNVETEDHYNASGSVVSSGQTGYVTEAFGFTGKLFEAYTSLQYNNARWYDAAVGRWISKDFIWDGTNRSAYVGNAPTMYVDPSGLWRWFGWFRGPEKKDNGSLRQIPDPRTVPQKQVPQMNAYCPELTPLQKELLEKSQIFGKLGQKLRHGMLSPEEMKEFNKLGRDLLDDPHRGQVDPKEFVRQFPFDSEFAKWISKLQTAIKICPNGLGYPEITFEDGMNFLEAIGGAKGKLPEVKRDRTFYPR